MSSSVGLRPLIAMFVVFLACNGTAQTSSEPHELGEYRPTIGQPGKDVIWLPTSKALVERMLRMANVGPEDYVIDLGSGDGRTVIMAAKEFGARALGIEYNPDMVALSKRNAARAGVSDQVDFVEADIFETDFSRATVLTMYLLPSLNLRLRPRILEMRPGTRVVSNSFDMADWQPDDVVVLESQMAYLWIVPANVAGSWRVAHRSRDDEETWTFKLNQDFQVLSGRVHIDNQSFPIRDPQMRGASFGFHFIDASGERYDVVGRAHEGSLGGTVGRPDGTSTSWSAVPGRPGFSLIY